MLRQVNKVDLKKSPDHIILQSIKRRHHKLISDNCGNLNLSENKRKFVENNNMEKGDQALILSKAKMKGSLKKINYLETTINDCKFKVIIISIQTFLLFLIIKKFKKRNTFQVYQRR